VVCVYDASRHVAWAHTRPTAGFLATKVPARAARDGESPAAAYGRRIHQEYDYGPGYVKEAAWQIGNAVVPGGYQRKMWGLD